MELDDINPFIVHTVAGPINFVGGIEGIAELLTAQGWRLVDGAWAHSARYRPSLIEEAALLVYASPATASGSA